MSEASFGEPFDVGFFLFSLLPYSSDFLIFLKKYLKKKGIQFAKFMPFKHLVDLLVLGSVHTEE